jgi:hypothetical protein
MLPPSLGGAWRKPICFSDQLEETYECSTLVLYSLLAQVTFYNLALRPKLAKLLTYCTSSHLNTRRVSNEEKSIACKSSFVFLTSCPVCLITSSVPDHIPYFIPFQLETNLPDNEIALTAYTNFPWYPLTSFQDGYTTLSKRKSF